jgi:hypothetical protein
MSKGKKSKLATEQLYLGAAKNPLKSQGGGGRKKHRKGSSDSGSYNPVPNTMSAKQVQSQPTTVTRNIGMGVYAVRVPTQ